ncbi:MAG TPA: A24 family peptidase, partial [Synergistaceae bacterium]|nr:A24 family peptidase [Synergistaceae bacterium]
RLFGGLPGILDGLGGAALGYGVIAGIILLTKVLMKQEGMGWGDAHLMAGAGAILGWKFASLALYLGFMLGGMVILPLFLLKKVQRKDAIPLGPFLALGSILTLVVGPQLLDFLYFSSSWPW